MRTLMTAAAVLLVVCCTVGVAYAQHPGEVVPVPSSSEVIGNMNYTFKVHAAHPVVREAQVALKEQGFYAGPLDGVRSPETKAAIWNFQKAKGLPATTSLDPVTLAALGVGGDAVYASPRTGEAPGRATRPPFMDMQAP